MDLTIPIRPLNSRSTGARPAAVDLNTLSMLGTGIRLGRAALFGLVAALEDDVGGRGCGDFVVRASKLRYSRWFSFIFLVPRHHSEWSFPNVFALFVDTSMLEVDRVHSSGWSKEENSLWLNSLEDLTIELLGRKNRLGIAAMSRDQVLYLLVFHDGYREFISYLERRSVTEQLHIFVAVQLLNHLLQSRVLLGERLVFMLLHVESLQTFGFALNLNL